MTNHRQQRVEDAIRACLSDLLLTEARDPRLRLATVTSVQVSRDLAVANIAVSFSDPAQDRRDCIAALSRAAGFFRHQLSQRLSLRHTPELRFRLDRGAEYSERIENLLMATGIESSSVKNTDDDRPFQTENPPTDDRTPTQ